jgi:hypothetical protein
MNTRLSKTQKELLALTIPTYTSGQCKGGRLMQLFPINGLICVAQIAASSGKEIQDSQRFFDKTRLGRALSYYREECSKLNVSPNIKP